MMDGIQDSVMLEGNVWIDETFIKVRRGDIEKRPDGKEYRGLPRNRMCIGVECDKNNVFFCFK